MSEKDFSLSLNYLGVLGFSVVQLELDGSFIPPPPMIQCPYQSSGDINMYIPKSFAVADAETLYQFMRAHNFATLVTYHQGHMTASSIPVMVDSERGVLKAHLARANDQWKSFDGGESLVIFQGAHAYISPTWYGEHPSVPTWNYTAVHVYGVPTIIDDDATIRAMLGELVANHETGHEPEWQMALPEDYMQKMIKSIVVFEIPIERVEGKFKMSQNRPAADQVGVIAHLAASPDLLDQQTADVMRSLQKVDSL